LKSNRQAIRLSHAGASGAKTLAEAPLLNTIQPNQPQGCLGGMSASEMLASVALGGVVSPQQAVAIS
jgi:hypothetical protein